MKKIVSWIEREGVNGYLSFEENDLKITLSDPKEKVEEKKEDKKRPRAASLEAAEKKLEKKKDVQKKGIPTNCKELNDILKLYSKMVNSTRSQATSCNSTTTSKLKTARFCGAARKTTFSGREELRLSC